MWKSLDRIANNGYRLEGCICSTCGITFTKGADTFKTFVMRFAPALMTRYPRYHITHLCVYRCNRCFHLGPEEYLWDQPSYHTVRVFGKTSIEEL